MIKEQSTVLIIGAGKCGVAAARLLLAHEHRVLLFDDKDISKLHLVDETLKRDHRLSITNEMPSLKNLAFAVISPGVPLTHPLVTRLQGENILIYNEIDVAIKFLSHHKIIGITGTNGKSTTTVMLENILHAAGLKAVACGNLGTPLCELALDDSYDFYVVELSSYQLETLSILRLDAAIILNITPDHLDRYPSFTHYQNAKLGITKLLKQDGILVVNLALTSYLSAPHREKACSFSYDHYGKGAVAFLQQVGIAGAHNQENAMAAALLALNLGIDESAIMAGLNNFRPLPHRCEIVAIKNGITFINDSKGTTVVATEKALSMHHKPTHLFLGGIDKGESFLALNQSLFPHIKGYYVFGQSKAKIMTELNSDVAEEFISLEDAFAAAVKNAQPGDVLLLSPSCASFDQFNNFQHRGAVFKELVAAL